jgi:hypothetical protein
MGKSSLWERVANKLGQEGFRCVTVDLTKLGKPPSEELWYRLLFYELVKNFSLSISSTKREWWDSKQDVSPINRLDQFVEDVLLPETDEPIVICLDESDSVLSLNFTTDQFFAWIRSCYNQRSSKNIYNRLIFCILGVATVANFIRDSDRTPFNIRVAIPLLGFNLSEAGPLIEGLRNRVNEPSMVVEEILEWTGGQPFLTQKICKLIYDSRSITILTNNRVDVTDFVQERIINNWQSQDEPEHLRSISNRLLGRTNSKKMLQIYQQILDRGEVDDDSSLDSIYLVLTGLVVKYNGKLKAYNKIYKRVFSPAWIREELEKIPPYFEKFESWKESGRNEFSLLSGSEVDDALNWSKDKQISELETQFLRLSKIRESESNQKLKRQSARQSVQSQLESVFNGEQLSIIVDEVLSWTGSQLQLNEIVCKLLIQQQNSLSVGREREFVKNTIETYIVDNWQQKSASEHLAELSALLTTNQATLEIYKNILESWVSKDDNPEKLALLEAGLVINNNGFLEISNNIYKQVFNLGWVEQEIESIVKANKRKTSSITKQVSLVALLGFVGLSVVWNIFTSKKEYNPDPPKIGPNPTTSQLPQVCKQRLLTISDDIKELESLEKSINKFPPECKTQLDELRWIQKAIARAKDGYVAGNKDVDYAFEALCEIPASSSNIKEAKFWVARWYEDDVWKPSIKKALQDNPNCQHLSP